MSNINFPNETLKVEVETEVKERGRKDSHQKIILPALLPNSGQRWSLKTVLYSLDPENPTKSRGSNLHVHFKNTYETAHIAKGMHIWKATTYLKGITLQKWCVSLRHYNGGVGGCAQAKQWGSTQGWWPKKHAEFLPHMFKNIESNAELKGCRCGFSDHWAHGQSSWADLSTHELSLPHWDDSTEKEEIVPKSEEEVAQKIKISLKKLKK